MENGTNSRRSADVQMFHQGSKCISEIEEDTSSLFKLIQQIGRNKVGCSSCQKSHECVNKNYFYASVKHDETKSNVITLE